MVVDRFNDRALPCKQFIFENNEPILHVLANRRDQLQPLGEELLKELLREIVAVADQLAPQTPGHLWHWFAVIYDVRRELNRQQFTPRSLTIRWSLKPQNHPMLLLLPLGYVSKDPIATDAPVVADGQLGRTIYATSVVVPNRSRR